MASDVMRVRLHLRQSQRPAATRQHANPPQPGYQLRRGTACTSDHLSDARPPITWGIPLTAQT